MSEQDENEIKVQKVEVQKLEDPTIFDWPAVEQHRGKVNISTSRSSYHLIQEEETKTSYFWKWTLDIHASTESE
jgi:hypothetical protein